MALAAAVVGLARLYRPEVKPLVFAVIPGEDADATKLHFAPMVEYLNEKLDMAVELLTVADYTATVEAMKYKHADLARFGPFSYVLATQEADVEAIVRGVNKATGEDTITSLIITRKDSGVTDLNGKTFAFVDVASTTGGLIPLWYIKTEGIELGDIVYAGGHPAVIEMVKNGAVDAGACAINRLDVALAEGVVAEGELKILWESPPIPHSPIAVRSDLDVALKRALRDAFLNAPSDIVEGLGIGEIGFVLAEDSDYDIVREIQEAVED